MAKSRALRRALLAASAAALALSSSALAAPSPPLAAPTEFVAPATHAVEETQAKSSALEKVGLAAATAAALAALVHLIGVDRLFGWLRAAAPRAKRAAAAVVRAPVEVARAVGRAAASPLRFVIIAAGLGLFALTGLNLFDVEWAGGLVAGAALVALFWAASFQGGRLLAAVRRRGKGDDEAR